MKSKSAPFQNRNIGRSEDRSQSGVTQVMRTALWPLPADDTTQAWQTIADALMHELASSGQKDTCDLIGLKQGSWVKYWLLCGLLFNRFRFRTFFCVS